MKIISNIIDWWNAPKIHGFRLDQWDYLGLCKIVMTENDAIWDSTIVNYFIRKSDGVRKFHVRRGWKRHGYYQVLLNWQVGLEPIWRGIERPSQYLKDYMKTNHNYIWDNDIEWWKEYKPVDNNKKVSNNAKTKGRKASA